MSDFSAEELRELVAQLTVLGARVVWDGDRVHSIAMFGNEITDRDLALLRKLPGLREVNLTKTEISDAGLFHLAKVESLEVLLLGGTDVTDEGLEFLASLENLRQLNLSRTGISDDGLRFVSRLKNLEYLWLDTTDITDAGAELLVETGSLKLLDLCGTAITDGTLAGLSNLVQLEELNLAGCDQITGDGLMHLAALTRLDWLGLDATAIDDSSLSHLRDLPLTTLSLNWTEITEDGLAQLHPIQTLSDLRILGAAIDGAVIDKFRSARPECVVQHSPGPADGSIMASRF